MNVMLKMFEPTTLPTAIASLPCKAAITLTASSGTDVPAATTVRPMTAGVTPRQGRQADGPAEQQLAAGDQQDEAQGDQPQRNDHEPLSCLTARAWPRTRCHPGRGA